MRMRTAAVGLLAAGLLLAACGKSGKPSDDKSDSNAAKLPTYAVAKNVTLSGSPTFAKMKSAGSITIGVKDDQPGLGEKDPTTGKYEGFDIEIARLVAAGLGFDQSKLKYTTIDSAAREQAIANGQVDYYVGTYTINDERKKQVSFAGPYFQAGQGLLVRKDDDSITGPQSLKGKKVCSVTGSTPIQRVREQKLTQPSNIVEFQKYSQCVDKLSSKDVDAVTTDDAILKGYAAQEPDSFKVVGKPFSKEPYGIGLKKNDKVLRGKIDDLLQSAIDDGTWQKIYDATLGKSGASVSKPTIDRY